ncbi:MAG: FRG domain-containing protein [Deltaproteobacteria bacterium]|nr:FRG domain-containing protein [Deltaproteobacteria bacterium]
MEKSRYKHCIEYQVDSVDSCLRVIFDDLEAKFIYRGQACEFEKNGKEWKLEPAIFRIPRTKGPVSLLPFELYEKKLFEKFKKLSISFIDKSPNNDWEYLALARHHGLPTRFLDWSDNPLVALYFAVENPNSKQDSIFWCYSHQSLSLRIDRNPSPFDIDRLYVYRPPHLLPRIAVQSGVFTVHPFETNEQEDVWLEHLVKIKIPANSRVRIRKELEKLGIHRASLFPDLEGIALHITRTLQRGGLPDEQD